MKRQRRGAAHTSQDAGMPSLVGLALVVGVASFLLSGCGQGSVRIVRPINQENIDEVAEELVDEQSKIQPPESAGDYEGQDYQDVVSEFETAGFTDITIQEAPTNEASKTAKPGEVLGVSIGGDKTFSSSYYYLPDTEVVITYQPLDSTNSSK